jgi:hypothetical protein
LRQLDPAEAGDHFTKLEDRWRTISYRQLFPKS